MATIQGTGGAVLIDDVSAKFTSWTASMNGELFDVTGFGDQGWQTNEIITGQVTGSAIGVIEDTAPLAAGAFAETFGADTMTGTVLLTVETGKTWSFEASITAVELGRAEHGAGSSTFRVDFSSSGVVSQTWS